MSNLQGIYTAKAMGLGQSEHSELQALVNRGTTNESTAIGNPFN